MVVKRKRAKRKGGALVRRAVGRHTLLDRAKAFAKKHQLISRGLSGLASAMGSHQMAPLISAGSSLASSYGYGRRVRRKPAVRRKHGRGFFGDLWSGIKDRVRKPSTWLGGLSMLPTPLSIPLKVAGTVAGLAGHGRRRKRGGRTVRKRRAPVRRVGRGMMSVSSMTDPL